MGLDTCCGGGSATRTLLTSPAYSPQAQGEQPHSGSAAAAPREIRVSGRQCFDFDVFVSDVVNDRGLANSRRFCRGLGASSSGF